MKVLAAQRADHDWPLLPLAQLKFTGAKILYGSPCGLAVPLEETYWCEDSQMIIGEQVGPSPHVTAVR